MIDRFRGRTGVEIVLVFSVQFQRDGWMFDGDRTGQDIGIGALRGMTSLRSWLIESYGEIIVTKRRRLCFH